MAEDAARAEAFLKMDFASMSPDKQQLVMAVWDAALKAERARCAAICDQLAGSLYDIGVRGYNQSFGAEQCARKIRERE